MKYVVLVFALLFAAVSVEAKIVPPKTPEEKAALAQKIQENLTGKTGKIELPGQLATVNLVGGYTFLDTAKARFLLEDLWNNPPNDKVLGIILPPNFSLSADSSNSWVSVVTYDNQGHVKDEDASSINYDDLLRQIQEGTQEANAERRKQGFETVEVKGWATKPHYDANEKKLYWAKELLFEGYNESTLNYEIRILGREGVLDLNVVGEMKDLPSIQVSTPGILSMVDFNPGQKYADYNPATDHVAEIGVAGLILGGIAAKAGFFKILLAALAASWKFIAIGLVAVGGFLLRLFGRKKKAQSTTAPPAPSIDERSTDERSSTSGAEKPKE